MSSLLWSVLPSLVLPFVVAGVLCVPFVRQRGPAAWRRGLAALAIGLGYLSGHLAINGLPPLRPVETSQWLPYLVLAATALGAAEATLELRSPWRFAPRGLLLAALVWLSLRPLLKYSWSAGQAALWLGGILAGAVLLWLLVDRVTDGAPGLALLVSWLLVAGVGGLLLLLSGSARLGQMCGSLAAALAAPALMLLVRPLKLEPALLVAPLVAFFGIWLNGAFYTELPALASTTAPLALLAPAVCLVPWLARRKGWQGGLAAGAVTLLLLLPALVRVVEQFRAASQSEGAEYYY